MTVMRIDNKSSDSSVSPDIQPEQASVKPPNQFAFKRMTSSFKNLMKTVRFVSLSGVVLSALLNVALLTLN